MANYYELNISSSNRGDLEWDIKLLQEIGILGKGIEMGSIIERCEHGTNLNLDFPCTEVEESEEYDCN